MSSLFTRSKTKPRDPGKLDLKNFGKIRDKFSFNRQSISKSPDDDSPPRTIIKTVPAEARPDDHDLHTGTPIANEFARPRVSQEFPIQGTTDDQTRQHSGAGMSNGVQQDQITHVLHAQGPTVHQNPSDSSAPSTSGYQFMFANDSDIYRKPRADEAQITPSPEPDSATVATELPNNVVRAELAAVSPLSEPVEAPTSPVIANTKKSFKQQVAELPSTSRPPHPNMAPRANDTVPHPTPNQSGRPDSRQFKPYSPEVQQDLNAPLSMALQGARAVYNPRIVLSESEPARHGAPHLDPVQVDQGSLDFRFPQHESDEEITKPEPQQQQRAFPLAPRKRDSQDDTASQLQKVDQPQNVDQPHNVDQPQTLDQPQALNQPKELDRPHKLDQPKKPDQHQNVAQPKTLDQPKKPSQPQKPKPQPADIDDSDFSDQRRLGDFLKTHDVPRNPRFDRLATLFVWVEAKLAEDKQKDVILAEQTTDLDLYERENAELKREIADLKRKISSIQTSDNSRARLQKQQGQQLEHANRTIDTLQRDLQTKTQTVNTLQDRVNDITIERDQIENERAQAEYKQNQVEENYRQLFLAKQNIEQQWEEYHQAEMSRVEQDYAGQVDVFRNQIEQEKATLKDQLEQKRVALKSQMENERVAFRNQMQQDRLQFQSRIDGMSQEHKQEMELKEADIRDMAARHDIASREMIAGHEAARRDMAARHDNTIRDMVATHDASIQTLQTNHQKDMELQEKNLRELRRRMASYNNTGGYTAISDDDFRNRFQKLTRGINNLIKLVPRPQTYAVDGDLDPNGFLARTAQQGGRNWPKFVRSVCWRSILRGFYSQKLGFGAFGSGGEGFEELDQLRQLFAVLDPLDPSGVRATLPNTKELNTWRASFFDALAKTIAHGTTGQTTNKYTRLFRANMEAVTQDTVSSLQRVANARLDPRIWDEVAGFVEGLGTLALEMGSQRAHVYLETCSHGESVTVGDRFRDDADLGYEVLQVDLMTQPCLTRVGDGREDLQTARTIVKGDFVALKPGQF
ncbi:hypothetical protein QQX98_000639 [Neonectria punicea]|uniref:Spc7 kinetochore protein domain-containing protein n=1 Tax=Neonectria punicea TaxID=979145 RepID=A0ABR1HS97_9HYPO